jgi:hypothetical protein
MITCINNQLNIFFMNKVILSISAMLLVSAVAVAQSNGSTVNQTGTSNDALVAQTGMSNVSDVLQNGMANDADVEQVDLNNNYSNGRYAYSFSSSNR